MKPLLITIDGPAGAGKTTVSKALADALGYRYIDTGALYRAIALHALERGLAADDDTGLAALCAELELRFVRQSDGVRLVANASSSNAPASGYRPRLLYTVPMVSMRVACTLG